ncbi:hypothetical protein BKA67DRAFT_664161 [Truncatella angustata]|uniref:Uncharacterized protein n=1 Tax=Truncatella angustata TaxID=152316 RepID=A0A9P8RI67_9PEZI|nr:uncharacterized protein BKA67DRAFT_664161 [Truncatella angustata]KAH6646317.1 hypothetical protein BKA67DRAFT_664161 [Truncatella angustata]KAH8201146.1 hypothetical protein TruAng_004696 [Truncatella angustata]
MHLSQAAPMPRVAGAYARIAVAARPRTPTLATSTYRYLPDSRGIHPVQASSFAHRPGPIRRQGVVLDERQCDLGRVDRLPHAPVVLLKRQVVGGDPADDGMWTFHLVAREEEEFPEDTPGRSQHLAQEVQAEGVESPEVLELVLDETAVTPSPSARPATRRCIV